MSQVYLVPAQHVAPGFSGSETAAKRFAELWNASPKSVTLGTVAIVTDDEVPKVSEKKPRAARR